MRHSHRGADRVDVTHVMESLVSKTVGDMSARRSGHQWNHIPSGRQLRRTPPPLERLTRHLDFCNEDPNESWQHMGPRSTEEKVVPYFITPEKNTENTTDSSCTNSMLRGMMGYQPQPGDLEFIKNLKEEKVMKAMQSKLEEVQKLLKLEEMALKEACVFRDMAEFGLNKLPSSEELTKWSTVVLQMASPLRDLTDLGVKSLLAKVTEEKIQSAMNEKRADLSRLKMVVENRTKEQNIKRRQLKIQIAAYQFKIQEMMRQLSVLKSDLAREEDLHKTQQIKMKRGVKEKKAEGTTEEVKTQRRGRIKKNTKAEEASNQSLSTRSARDPVSVKEDQASRDQRGNVKAAEAQGAKQTSKDKTSRAAKGPQRKEEQVRGRRAKSPAPAPKPKPDPVLSTSQPTAPSRNVRKTAAAPRPEQEEVLRAGPRRSKRIANKKHTNA